MEMRFWRIMENKNRRDRIRNATYKQNLIETINEKTIERQLECQTINFQRVFET